MNKVLKLDPSFAPLLEGKLRRLGFEKRENPNVIFAYKGNDLQVVFYPTGTLLIQGKGDIDQLVKALSEDLSLDYGYIGTDEAGKGDLFGPLVVCGFALKDEKTAKELFSLGVKDSKTLSTSALEEIAQQLMELNCHLCHVIEPEVYNQLYRRFQNLNKLLGFAHANVIDGLFIRTGLTKAVTDRFMKGSFVDCYLNAPIELEETTGAERYAAVAAASIIARYLYNQSLKKLSKIAGIQLKAGSGEDAKRILLELRSKFDRKTLEKLAKLHFKV